MRIEKRTDIPAKNEGVCRMERLVRVDRFSRVVEDGLELGAKQRVGYFDFWLYCIKKHEFFGRLVFHVDKDSMELTAAFVGFRGVGANSDDLARLEEGPWLYSLA